MLAAPTKMDTMTLLQRQLEVSGSLREKVTTAEQLEEVRHTMNNLVDFFTKINRLATKLQLGLEIVFQCLMQMGLGDAVNFDKQCRQGNVPMHQAKILDRNMSLQATQTKPRVEAAVAPDDLVILVDQCRTLRTQCRMKVEDGNDLSMARKMVLLASEYLNYINTQTQGNISATFKAYLAEDEHQLRAALGKAPLVAGEGEGQEQESQEQFPDPPKGDLSKAITQLCTPLLLSTKSPFPQRTTALSTLKQWIERALDVEFTEEVRFFNVINALHGAIKLHLAEKRSVLCRTACSIVTTLCLRSQPTLLTHTKVKEIVHSWLAVLLTQVHVTVSAIATASDTTVRDIIVSTQGCGVVVTAVMAALNKAAQSPLRRKCLGFVCLCVVASPYGTDYNNHTTAVLKYASNSDDGCRRLSRYLGIILEAKGAWGGNGAFAPWDPKVEKLAAGGDRSEVLRAVMGEQPVEAVEVTLLRYDVPCEASALVEEKISDGNRRGQSTLLLSSQSSSSNIEAFSSQQSASAASALGGSQGSSTGKPASGSATASPFMSQPSKSALGAASSSVNKPQATFTKPSSSSSSFGESTIVTNDNNKNNSPKGVENRGRQQEDAVQPFPQQSTSQHQPQQRVNTPGVPLSLSGFSQRELSGSFVSQGGTASPTDLTASLKARRRSSQTAARFSQ